MVNKELVLLIMEFVVRLLALLAIPYGYGLIKQYNLEKAVKYAVQAADQILKEEDPTGEKRKAFVQKYILDRFKLDEEDLQVLLEAWVNQLNIEQNKLL